VESQAYQDARTLINEWGKTKKHPSRRSVSLSDDRHKAATDVLQAKGIVIKPRDNQVTWVAPDASTALLLLAAKQPVPLGWSGGVATNHQDSEGVTE